MSVTERLTSGSVQLDLDAGRPLLWLTVTGLNNRSWDIRGMVDSGASSTGLPLEDALRLGYTWESVEESEGVAFNGSRHPVLRATRPCAAMIRDQFQAPTFELWPIFHPARDQDRLWGRHDFLHAFRLGMDAQADVFTLAWNLAEGG